MENDENHIYGVTRSHFFGFLWLWFCLGILSVYLFFSANEGKILRVIESNWLWILLIWCSYAHMLVLSVKARMKNANMEDNMSFLCYVPFIGIVAILDGLKYPTNPFYRRPTNEELEVLENKKYLLLGRIKLINETQHYFNNYRAYLRFKNIEEVYDREFDGMLHTLNSDIKNYNALMKHIEVLENQIAPKEIFFKNYIQKPCQHNILYGYMSPNRCPQCWEEFCNWIEEAHRKVQEKIKIEKEIEEEDKRQRKEEHSKYLKFQRILKKKQALDRYKKSFRGKMSPEEIGAAYERYIGYLYEIEGFDVIYNGIKKGKKDDSVDIIAKKRKEIYIIQCKWYKQDSQVHINTIRQFNDKFVDFKKDNSDKKVHAILVTAYDNLDEEGREKLSKTEIDHRVIPFDYTYPMIKCNINESNGEKIYHLPGVGQYDKIKINVKKNECYVYTIEEAEALGFREVE